MKNCIAYIVLAALLLAALVGPSAFLFSCGNDSSSSSGIFENDYNNSYQDNDDFDSSSGGHKYDYKDSYKDNDDSYYNYGSSSNARDEFEYDYNKSFQDNVGDFMDQYGY